MQFFVLKRVVFAAHDTVYEDMEPIHVGDAQRCPLCGRYVGMLPWLPPYRATLKVFGRALGDIAFGPGSSKLVSDRFRRAWESARLRGIEFAPVERLRVRPSRLGKNGGITYFRIAVQLFGTQVDLARSRIEYNPPLMCDKCKGGGVDAVRGYAIDESSWTGEDIFYPWGLSGTIVVTDRVRQLRDDHGLTNVNLTPVEDYFWDPLYKYSEAPDLEFVKGVLD